MLAIAVKISCEYYFEMISLSLSSRLKLPSRLALASIKFIGLKIPLEILSGSLNLARWLGLAVK